MYMKNYIWLLSFLFLVVNFGNGYYIDLKLPDDDLYRPGDLLIGALSPIYEIVPNNLCGASKINNFRLQTISAMIFAIDQINADPKLLPNISLGYVVVNDCERESVAVAKATKFITDDEAPCLGEQPPPGAVYKVVSFISPPSSAMSVPVSSLLSLYKIPHMSWTASSQELSDKARFGYFSRVIPPDQYQSKVMVSIIRHFNWTYISTLYSEGSYGTNGIRAVEKQAKLHDICIAYSKQLRFDETDEDFDNLIDQLRRHRKARVIVMFIASQHVTAFLSAVNRKGAIGEFIMIGGDGFSPDRSLFPYALNSFSITWSIDGRSPEFEDFYLKQNPWWNATGNPWMGEFRDVDVGCSWDIPAGQPGSCRSYTMMSQVPGFTLTEWYTLMMDAIWTFGLGLHDLIKENCPGARKKQLERCIQGPLLQEYLMRVKFQGVSGWIEFDENGDALGNYKVMHYFKDEAGTYDQRRVATWTRRGEKLSVNEKLIQWHNYVQDSDVNRVFDQNAATGEERLKLMIWDMVPESVCAKPCAVGEFYIMGELKCCWECRRCRTNERVREDEQGCVTCPKTTWPDDANYTTCVPIPPTYMLWLDPITLGLVALSAIGVLATVSISWVFISNSERKVIKGSNRELMVPIILGLFLAYASVFLYITKPEKWSCYSAYYGFHLCCTLIFGPLFLKCCRLYRIFEAAEKCKTRIRFVNSVSQVILMIFIFLVQVGITTTMVILSAPAAFIQMPVPTERYVELLCSLPLINLVLPLSYNLLLLLLCALYGFLTRKLPDNFNESWYIFISVTTTLFVWIAFLPTYFVTFYAYHKAALLALALILNSGVTTLCLFAPKLYALRFVDETKIKVTNFDFEPKNDPK